MWYATLSHDDADNSVTVVFSDGGLVHGLPSRRLDYTPRIWTTYTTRSIGTYHFTYHFARLWDGGVYPCLLVYTVQEAKRVVLKTTLVKFLLWMSIVDLDTADKVLIYISWMVMDAAANLFSATNRTRLRQVSVVLYLLDARPPLYCSHLLGIIISSINASSCCTSTAASHFQQFVAAWWHLYGSEDQCFWLAVAPHRVHRHIAETH